MPLFSSSRAVMCSTTTEIAAASGGVSGGSWTQTKRSVGYGFQAKSSVQLPSFFDRVIGSGVFFRWAAGNDVHYRSRIELTREADDVGVPGEECQASIVSCRKVLVSAGFVLVVEPCLYVVFLYLPLDCKNY